MGFFTYRLSRKKTALAALLVSSVLQSVPALEHPPIPKPRQDARLSAGRLMAEVVAILHVNAIAAEGRPQVPRFASIGLDRDEYIYNILEQHFIRTIQKRFELPSWRHCGDWAQIRIEIQDEDMNTIGSPELWVFAFRDDEWKRLSLDEGGLFRKSNLEEVQLPPYAVRCFNLDHKELTDTLQ